MSAPAGDPPVTPTSDDGGVPRPLFNTIGAASAPDSGASSSPQIRVHVVHNGDTLARLAKRYLHDEGRALEIFDLNRDVLTNPHLLPIGAELKIPAAPQATDD